MSRIPSSVSGMSCDGNVTGEKLIDVVVPPSLALSCDDAPLPPKKLLKKSAMSSKMLVSSPLVESGVDGNEAPFLDVDGAPGTPSGNLSSKVTIDEDDLADEDNLAGEDNLADENTFDFPTFLVLKVGDDVDAMNDEVSGVSFDSFLLLTMNDDVGLLPVLFPNFETLLVDLKFVKNGDTNDLFGCFALISEDFFDDFFDVNEDDLLALFLLVDLTEVDFETFLNVLFFLDVNFDALLALR